MKPIAWFIGLLACCNVIGTGASSAENAPQQEVTVVVVNAGVNPARPVQKARVSLTYLDGTTVITVSGATRYDATNGEGKAMLLVAIEAAQRGNLRIKIADAGDLVIYEPADGQLNGLPATVDIKLLPKGSPTLLGPIQVEAMLRRLSFQNKHLKEENRVLKGELSTVQNQKPEDMTDAIAEWANANGFEIAEAGKQVRQWAEDIQKRKDQATDEQKALAELALKHYGAAAQLFNQVAVDIGQSMDDDEKRFLEERRTKLRDLVSKSLQSSNAYQLDLKYHLATQILEQARDRAAAEHGRYSDDAALRSIWLEAIRKAADARMKEGVYGAANESSVLLNQSITDYQVLLREYSSQEEREDWATTQNNLGDALEELGARGSGAQAMDLLAQAVQAYQAALTVRTKANHPRDWAITQNTLGIALVDQGERSSGTQATELLAQAVQDFQAALEVRTKEDLPRDWAKTQNNLGYALVEQGERSSGTQATKLFTQGAQAFRAALEVRTKVDLPQDWAATQNNLGTALVDQAEGSVGEQSTNLLAQAVQAYQAALEVRTKAALPQSWAMTENNLGNALLDQGERSSGAQSTNLLAQAVQAYQNALEVYSKADLPQDWAMAQINIGNALERQGERCGGAQAANLFAQAVQAYRAALEIYTKEYLPKNWAGTQNNLGKVLAEQGEQSSGAQAAELWDQAVQAYQASLEVFTRSEMPREWATTQFNLGRIYADQGNVSGASRAFDLCLDAFPSDIGILRRVLLAYRNKLYLFDRAYELTSRWLEQDDSPYARLSMMEADLTTNHFADCEKQAANIADSEFSSAAMPMIRDMMKLACQWGAGEKDVAQKTENALLPKAAQLKKSGWNFAGTNHFLASAQAFATGRASWIALFDSLGNGDGAAVAEALKKLEEAMKN